MTEEIKTKIDQKPPKPIGIFPLAYAGKFLVQVVFECDTKEEAEDFIKLFVKKPEEAKEVKDDTTKTS